MRLEKKRQEQLGKRKGLAGKTVIFVIWLLISFAIAYFLTEYLFSEGYLTERIYYTDLRLPTSIPLNGLKFITMFVIVVVMQIVFTLGYMIASPEGRRRTGDATLYSRNKDPFDDGRY
jgi:preprotein translocase subunit SecE